MDLIIHYDKTFIKKKIRSLDKLQVPNISK